MRYPIFLLFFLCCSFLSGQQVETLIPVSSTHSFEAISWNPDGRIYSVDFVNNRVYQINLDSTLTTIVPAISGPLGGAFDEAGDFYVSEYNTGKIWKVLPDGTSSVLAEGLDGSAGILVDSNQQRLFVSDYDASLIATIDLATGALDTLVRGGGLNGPDGIVYAPNGDLIVCNFNNNLIHRVTMEGEISLFATVTNSGNTGYITNFGEDYLVCGFASNRIWRVSADGQEVTAWAGSGTIGSADGPVAEATFFRPNGIALSVTGDTLMVNTGTSSGGIRLITGINNTTSTATALSADFPNIQLFPNPVINEVKIAYTLPNSVKVRLQLLSPAGREVAVLVDSLQQEGAHVLTYGVPAQLPAGNYRLVLSVNGKPRANKAMILSR